jgi:hypothetical protein
MSNGVYGACQNVAIAGATANQANSPLMVSVAGTTPVVSSPLKAQSIVTNAAPVASPTAGTTVAQITSANIPAGFYRCQVLATIAGNASSDNGNLQLIGGGMTARLAIPTNGGNGNAGDIYYDFTAGSTNVTASAVANATGGTTYVACIILTRLA